MAIIYRLVGKFPANYKLFVPDNRRWPKVEMVTRDQLADDHHGEQHHPGWIDLVVEKSFDAEFARAKIASALRVSEDKIVFRAYNSRRT